ncbi:hypothetical protein BJX62DRAFT_245748 [Aspergillus germanicus]
MVFLHKSSKASSSSPETDYLLLSNRLWFFSTRSRSHCAATVRFATILSRSPSGRYEAADLLDFLVPIFHPFWSKASANPYPDNLQGFLRRARTYLRLLPAGALAPYPEFKSLPCIDWGAYLKLWPSTKIWSLSDVKHFALNITTSSIFKVIIDGESKPLVYKMVHSYNYLVREVKMLLYYARVNVRAPRFQALIGIDKKWGGFLMTKVLTLFLLSELPWDTTQLDDRQ